MDLGPGGGPQAVKSSTPAPPSLPSRDAFPHGGQALRNWTPPAKVKESTPRRDDRAVIAHL
jgi:hypothetical protein